VSTGDRHTASPFVIRRRAPASAAVASPTITSVHLASLTRQSYAI
jgi:hypothetical protein